MTSTALARGIVSVLQTPFDEENRIDEASLSRLIEDAIACGVAGFLVPVVASEVSCLTADERRQIVALVASSVRGRVPWILGASADDPLESAAFAAATEELGAAAYLVAVPNRLYGKPDSVVRFFETVASRCRAPLVLQDLEFQGPGLDLDTIRRLRDRLPTLVGMKIETVPAGPKYTRVREALGDDLFIAGGWAVSQMVEALDRGVDAMMPESSMVRVYSAIDREHRAGNRARALALFCKLSPILGFTNQELLTSIAFFKRLLVRRGIFRTERMRAVGFDWDGYNLRIADELIDRYLTLEASVNEQQGATQ